MAPVPPYTAEDDEIRIRPYRLSDIALQYQAARESIQTVYEWLPWCHPEFSMADARGWVESRQEAWETETEYSFVVENRRTGEFLGSTGLNAICRTNQIANLGYWMRKSAAGKGYMTRAARLTAHFACNSLGLHRIEIVTAIDNVPSQRVAEKLGALREGVLRNRLHLHGAIHDCFLFSLVPDDFRDDLPPLHRVG